MQQEVIKTWNVDDLEDLMKALIDAEETAASMGYYISTVHPNIDRVSLVAETLSDGSKVLNLIFSESSLP